MLVLLPPGPAISLCRSIPLLPKVKITDTDPQKRDATVGIIVQSDGTFSREPAKIKTARTLKCLTIVDEFTRQGQRIKCGRSITSGDVIGVLNDLLMLHGAPAHLRSDNGPEFIAHAIKKWLQDRNIKTIYIDPGCPWQNPYNESFNSVFRDGCLNRYLFDSVREAQEIIDAWLFEYNHERPHGSLNGMTPAQFEQQHWQEGRDVIKRKGPKP